MAYMNDCHCFIISFNIYENSFYWKYILPLNKFYLLTTRVVAQWLRQLISLAEDLSLDPITHMEIHNHP